MTIPARLGIVTLGVVAVSAETRIRLHFAT
jgi:hypothetical protein